MPRDFGTYSDDQLVARCRARGGDDRSFALLFRRHRQMVWGISRRYFRSTEDVEDMVQDVFFRAFRSLDGFDGGEPELFRAWLARVAANHCKNELRRRSRRPRLANEEPPEAAIKVEADPTRTLESEDQRKRLTVALAQLTPDQRQILQLADLGEKPYPEIALELGLSLSAVKMRAVRARAALAAVYRALETHAGRQERGDHERA